MDIPQAQRDANMLAALEALDRLEGYHREIIARDHLLIDRRRGKVVINPDTGLPVLDHRPAEKAKKELAKISKHRDRLLGIETVEVRSDDA